MKLLLSSLLLGSLCAISSRSASSTDNVSQTLDVSVTEGDALNITCCFTLKSERMRFNWQKNQTDVWNQSSVVNNQSSCSTLTFSNIKIEDSGKYICNVNAEIPFHVEEEGNGTVITVKPRGSAENPDVPAAHSAVVPIILVSALVGLLLLIAFGCYCILRIRHAHAVRVIYEVPHIDSEEADMDKHSTSSSTGSSQWGAESQERVDKMMKDLDQNGDQEIDVMEYMSLGQAIAPSAHQEALAKKPTVSLVQAVAVVHKTYAAPYWQLATILLMETFKRYAGVEGKKDTLTKKEFKTLLYAEMPIFDKGAESQERFSKMMKDLDQNGDQEIDFMEYMSLVASITECLNEVYKE
ncbi:uncharacterized protein LOC133028852 [Limanda limanda]|uniref:uncharacterized protein LOC133028852 n=1 Tax=Limanda limanda TaxID=27771 RepID=UPI0029C8392B|nr:uncharacterized protein LOC133028852 [Limanda limanda]